MRRVACCDVVRAGGASEVAWCEIYGSGGLRPPPPVAAPLASSLRAPSRGRPPLILSGYRYSDALCPRRSGSNDDGRATAVAQGSRSLHARIKRGRRGRKCDEFASGAATGDSRRRQVSRTWTRTSARGSKVVQEPARPESLLISFSCQEGSSGNGTRSARTFQKRTGARGNSTCGCAHDEGTGYADPPRRWSRRRSGGTQDERPCHFTDAENSPAALVQCARWE